MLDTPSNWREAFARLSPTMPPCPGFRSDEWASVHASAKAFLTERANEAYQMGWRGIDLCGVHETVGAANVSACGALMLSTTTAPAEEIRPEYIRFGRMRYFRVAMRSPVLVWRFARAG